MIARNFANRIGILALKAVWVQPMLGRAKYFSAFTYMCFYPLYSNRKRHTASPKKTNV